MGGMLGRLVDWQLFRVWMAPVGGLGEGHLRLVALPAKDRSLFAKKSFIRNLAVQVKVVGLQFVRLIADSCFGPLKLLGPPPRRFLKEWLLQRKVGNGVSLG